MTWPFDPLRPLSYRVILADPPWRFNLRSAAGEGKSPQAHYACMSMAELRDLPVQDLAAGDCALVMWATWPMIREAIALMEAWGFAYKTGGSWAKRSRSGAGWAFGTGYILRSANEPFLVGTIGAPRIVSRSERNLLDDPVREHSRKPVSMHEKIERLFDGPYAELFARSARPGWTAWGNEVDKFEESMS